MSQEDCKRPCVLVFTLHNESVERGKNPKSEEVIRLIGDQMIAEEIKSKEKEEAGEIIPLTPIFLCEVFETPDAVMKFVVSRNIKPISAIGVFDGSFGRGGKCVVFMPRMISRWRTRIPSWSPALWNHMVNPSVTQKRTIGIAQMIFRNYQKFHNLKPGMFPMGEAPMSENHARRQRVKNEEKRLRFRLRAQLNAQAHMGL